MCTKTVSAIILTLWLGGLEKAEYNLSHDQREFAACMLVTQCTPMEGSCLLKRIKPKPPSTKR